jgi:PhnB protein
MSHDATSPGPRAVTEVTELCFGDRVGRVCDPFGNIWWLQTRVADVAPDEMMQRAQEPSATAAMEYVQRSLDEHLRARS